MNDSDFDPWYCSGCQAGPFSYDVGPGGWDEHWNTCEKLPRNRDRRTVGPSPSRTAKARAALEERHEAILRRVKAEYVVKLNRIRRNERIAIGCLIAFALLYLLACVLVPVIAPLLHKA